MDIKDKYTFIYFDSIAPCETFINYVHKFNYILGDICCSGYGCLMKGIDNETVIKIKYEFLETQRCKIER